MIFVNDGFIYNVHKYIADSLGVREYPVVFPSMSLRKDTLELKVEVKQATLNDKYIPQYMPVAWCRAVYTYNFKRNQWVLRRRDFGPKKKSQRRRDD